MRELRRHAGFTLIEAIVASVILCVSVLVLSSVSVKSLGQVKLNRQYGQAIELAQRQLVMIDYMGIEEFIKLGRMEGDFEGTEPMYHWAVAQSSVGIDSLYEVRVVVSWVERKRNYEVSVVSRFNGSGSLIEDVEVEES